MENTAIRLLSVAEVADWLNVERSWVYGKIASGGLPHVYVGRYPRFIREELIEWLRANRGA